MTVLVVGIGGELDAVVVAVGAVGGDGERVLVDPGEENRHAGGRAAHEKTGTDEHETQ